MSQVSGALTESREVASSARPICSIDRCRLGAHSPDRREFCWIHFVHVVIFGRCAVAGCDREHRYAGYCGACYMRCVRSGRLTRRHRRSLYYPAPLGDWVKRAACSIDRGDLWFPIGTASTEALATCASCPVRVECLTYALEHPDIFGIWGGTTRLERRRILKGEAA